MKVLELIKQLNTEDIVRAIKYYYPEGKRDYSNLIYELKCRAELDNVTGAIGINFIREYDEQWFQVLHYDNGEEYSTSFLDWDTYLNSKIKNVALKNYTDCDIIAHIIWDITFFGDEEKMKDTRAKAFSFGLFKNLKERL